MEIIKEKIENTSSNKFEEMPNNSKLLEKEEGVKDENGNLEKAREDINNAKEIIEKEYADIKSMVDFIEYLESKLELSEDSQEKKAIAISLLRIKSALAGLKIEPEKLKIGVTSDGKWSVYNKNASEFRVSEEMIEAVDDCRLSATEMNVSFREAMLEEKGINDVGLQQLQIEKLGINSGEYHKKERWSVKRIFGKWGEKNILEKAMDPKELADYFLEKEVAKRLNLGRKIKANDLAPYLTERFKKAAPKAYKKLIQSGYVFRASVEDFISNKER